MVASTLCNWHDVVYLQLNIFSLCTAVCAGVTVTAHYSHLGCVRWPIKSLCHAFPSSQSLSFFTVSYLAPVLPLTMRYRALGWSPVSRATLLRFMCSSLFLTSSSVSIFSPHVEFSAFGVDKPTPVGLT